MVFQLAYTGLEERKKTMTEYEKITIGFTTCI